MNIMLNVLSDLVHKIGLSEQARKTVSDIAQDRYQNGAYFFAVGVSDKKEGTSTRIHSRMRFYKAGREYASALEKSVEGGVFLRGFADGKIDRDHIVAESDIYFGGYLLGNLYYLVKTKKKRRYI